MKTRILATRVAAVAAIICLAPSLHAANRFWITSTGGGFGTPGVVDIDWSATDGGAGGATAPTTTDTANFTLNNTYTVTFSSGATNTLLDVANGTVTFDLNANTYTLTNTSAAVIGIVSGQTGRLTVSDGILGVDTNADSINIGQLADSTGFLTVTTGGRIGDGTIRPNIIVGSSGTGTLTVNDNGRVDGNTVTVGSIFGSTGTATITGPNAVADFSGATVIGSAGTGGMTVSNGGMLTTTGTAALGNALGADGTATISGAGSSWTVSSTTTIGSAGDGTLTISSGGLVSTTGAVTLGSTATGIGMATVTDSNSRWNLSNTQTIGSSGLGVITVSSGGQIASSSSATVGSVAGSEGRVTVTGAGSQWTLGSSIIVGQSGAGDLTVSDRGEVSTTAMVLGNAATGIGVATITGTGSKLTTTGILAVASAGAGGAGTLRVASGAEVYAAGNLTVNDPTGAPIGTLNLDGGSIYAAAAFTNSSVFNFTDGLLQVAGNFQPNATVNPLVINGADSGDLPTVELLGSTGTTTNVTNITVGNNRRGQLLLRQGRVLNAAANSVAIGALVGGEGTLRVESGAQLLAINTISVGGNGSTAGGAGTLNISGGTVDTVTLRIFSGGTVNLSTGTLAVDSTPTLDGQFNWTGGTLRFDANINLTSTNVPKLLGLDATLDAGQALVSTAVMTLQSPVVVDGGTLNPNSLNNESTLEVHSGSVIVNSTTNNLAGGHIYVERDFSVGGTLTNDNGARLTLAGGTGRLLGAGSVTNSGLLTGDGTITNAVTNSATGKVRVDAGKTLFFTGAFGANAGELNLQGGTLDFTGAITNSVNAFIAGRGALYTGGLTNNGQMAFSGGTADIHGDVTLAANSRVVTSGAGSVTTFFDDVVHNGLEIFTGASASTVIFGNQSGAGPFTGTGTVYYIGDLRPGNSPANVTYGGDLVFSGAASLTLEIGGATPGSQYDRLTIAGSAAIDGTLDVSLINGFMPTAGQQFTILTAGSIVNNGFVLGGSAGGSFSLLVNSTSVILQAIGLAGDYNNNGTVDAADYVLWRKSVNTGNVLANDPIGGTIGQAQYDQWRTHFGQTASSGAGSIANAAVPEPATLTMLIFAAVGWCLRRGRSTRKVPSTH